MLHHLLNRECGGGRRGRPSPWSVEALQRLLGEDLECDDEHGLHEIGEHQPMAFRNGTPPFSIAFCPHPGHTRWAAVADEEGTVTMLDTYRSAVDQPGAPPRSRRRLPLRHPELTVRGPRAWQCT